MISPNQIFNYQTSFSFSYFLIWKWKASKREIEQKEKNPIPLVPPVTRAACRSLKRPSTIFAKIIYLSHITFTTITTRSTTELYDDNSSTAIPSARRSVEIFIVWRGHPRSLGCLTVKDGHI